MATKKIRAELEVDTSKARQKVRELAETGGGSAGGGVADEAGNAARSLKELSSGAKEANGSMKSAVKGFAGMALGLAASYAASRMEPGSLGQRAVGAFGTVASSAITGAMIGSAAPGVGTAAGAAVGTGIGAAKAAVDWSAQDEAAKAAKEEQLRSLEEWERARAQTLAFKKTLEELTKEGGDASAQMSALTAEVERRRTIDANLAETQRQAISTGNAALLSEATAFRGRNAGQIDALEAAMRMLEKRGGGGGAATAFRDPSDAIARIGGAFGGGSPAAEMGREVKGIHETLRSIDRKTGGAAWQ